MKSGSVILAKIQQADGRLKARPTIVLNTMSPFSDLLVCAIISKLRHKCPGFDEMIDLEDDDYVHSGLKVASLIRLGMIATIPKSIVLGKLGQISESRLQRLRKKLSFRIKLEQETSY